MNMVFFTSWRCDVSLIRNIYNFIRTWAKARKCGARIALGKYEGSFEPSLVCPIEGLAFAREVMRAYNQDCILVVDADGNGRLEYQDGKREIIGMVFTLPALTFFKKENATLTTQGCIVVGE